MDIISTLHLTTFKVTHHGLMVGLTATRQLETCICHALVRLSPFQCGKEQKQEALVMFGVAEILEPLQATGSSVIRYGFSAKIMHPLTLLSRLKHQ